MGSFEARNVSLSSPEQRQEQSAPKFSRDAAPATLAATHLSDTELRVMLHDLEHRLRKEEANNDNQMGPEKIERLKAELRAIAVLLDTEQIRRRSRRRRRRVYRP